VRVVTSRYQPRWYFKNFHARRQRWAILVAHRRAGKTVAAVNDLVEKATYNTREAPRYAYIAPLLKQAKAIAWEYLKRFSAPFDPKISEAELYVELQALPNKPRITIYGADNPDSFRGMYFDGVVLDEFGNMVESTWKEVLLPALVDRRGWAVFMGTPNGPNHFRDMWYKRLEDSDWFTAMWRVIETNVISEDDLAEMRKIMEEEEYQQEMMCNFEAAVRGAIYARQMEAADAEGRIGEYPIDPVAPVDLTMDLGFKDAVTMGFAQRRFDGILLGASHGDNLKPIRHYIKYAKAFMLGSNWVDRDVQGAGDEMAKVRVGPAYRWGKIYLPHDAKARSLQTGKAIINHFINDSEIPKPVIVPKLEVIDGISAVRKTFPIVFINRATNQTFILAAKTYHRKYDEELKRYSDEPVHDWSSDWMDMFRYKCLMMNPKARVQEKKETPRVLPLPVDGRGMNYGFCLEDLWSIHGR